MELFKTALHYHEAQQHSEQKSFITKNRIENRNITLWKGLKHSGK